MWMYRQTKQVMLKGLLFAVLFCCVQILACTAKGQVVVPVPGGLIPNVRQIRHIGNSIWIVASTTSSDLTNQLSRLENGSVHPITAPSNKGSGRIAIDRIAKIGTEVWIVAHTPNSIGFSDYTPSAKRQYYGIDANKPDVAPEPSRKYSDNMLNNKTIDLRDLFNVQPESRTHYPGWTAPTIVNKFIFNGKTWVIAYKNSSNLFDDSPSLYRVDDGLNPVEIVANVNPSSVVIINNEIWCACSMPIFMADHNIIKSIKLDGNVTDRVTTNFDVNIITQCGQDTWVLSNPSFGFENSMQKPSAYRLVGQEAIRVSPSELSVNDIEYADKKVWMGTDQGVFVYEPSTKIQVKLKSKAWWNLGQLLPGTVLAKGSATPEISYTNLALSSYLPSPPNTLLKEMEKSGYDPLFRYIYANTRDELKRKSERQDFKPADSVEDVEGLGGQKRYVSVHDRWGNSFSALDNTYPPEKIIVVPGPFLFGFIILVVWLLVLCLAYAMAPHVLWFHNLLLNPFNSKIRFLWLVPILLSNFSFLRQHILKMYRRELANDRSFADWGQRFILPSPEFEPSEFGKQLQDEQTLLLLGQSGIGKTSYMRYLTHFFAGGDASGTELQSALLRRLVPIYIPLMGQDTAEPETLVVTQLKSYGRISDEELVKWFLKQGGFLIFLDGLNEITSPDKIKNFVDTYRRYGNYFCISSQEAYPGLDWKRLSLKTFGDKEIKAFLQKQLGQNLGEKCFNQFTANDKEIYQLPQDLRLLVEILGSDQRKVYLFYLIGVVCSNQIKMRLPWYRINAESIPHSHRELYQNTFAPIVKEREASGQAGNAGDLYRRAYEMLKKRDSFFDDPLHPLPEEIKNRLEDKKFIFKRGERYQLHDRVRAYLAAQHFTSRWSRLLAEPDVDVDTNWRSMLEFTVLNLCSASDVKDLLFTLLPKNKEVAGGLFQWIKQLQPDCCTEWADEFVLRYGAASLPVTV